MKQFFEDWDAIDTLLEQLCSLTCSRCFTCGAFRNHGYIWGFCTDGEKVMRAQRIRCLPSKGGCGYAPSLRKPHTIRGIESLMSKAGDVHYVLESTGGYERLAAWTLMRAKASVSIVNPSRVRLFARSMGELAKTDPIDAKIITLFAETAQPRTSKLPPESQRKLTVLVDRRRSVHCRKKPA